MHISNHVLARLHHIAAYIPLFLKQIKEGADDDCCLQIPVMSDECLPKGAKCRMEIQVWEAKLFFLCLKEWGDYDQDSQGNEPLNKLMGPRRNGANAHEFALKIWQASTVFKVSYLLLSYKWPGETLGRILPSFLLFAYSTNPCENANGWFQFFGSCDDLSSALTRWLDKGENAGLAEVEHILGSALDFYKLLHDLLPSWNRKDVAKMRGPAIKEGKAKDAKARAQKYEKILKSIEESVKSGLTQKDACERYFSTHVKSLAKMGITSARTLQNKFSHSNLPEHETFSSFSNRGRDEIAKADYTIPLADKKHGELKAFVKKNWKPGTVNLAFSHLHLPDKQGDE